jgi:uncharacterized protein YqjF (DUF2071 family)
MNTSALSVLSGIQFESNIPERGNESLHADEARKRILSVHGDPFVYAEWRNLVFLHFALPADEIRPHVHPALELELHEGLACVSLAAVTMRSFRPCSRWPFAQAFRLLKEQRFLNLRTYVRAAGEPGALFLWGWLSRPKLLPAMSGFSGLPFAFGELDYQHDSRSGQIRGVVRCDGNAGSLEYSASLDQNIAPLPCATGSAAAFAMERYSGFFCRRGEPVVFRAWHPPWLQVPLCVELKRRDLVENQFPWFKSASLKEANFAPGFEEVWLGRPHRLAPAVCCPNQSSHRHAPFFELP